MKIAERIFEVLFELVYIIALIIGATISGLDIEKQYTIPTNQFIWLVFTKVIVPYMLIIYFAIAACIKLAKFDILEKIKEQQNENRL
jgi:hypothetical protein